MPVARFGESNRDCRIHARTSQRRVFRDRCFNQESGWTGTTNLRFRRREGFKKRKTYVWQEQKKGLPLRG